MTKIYLERDGDRYTISAKGHATGDNSNVCNAVSALLWTLAGYLANEDSISILQSKVGSGDSLIQYIGGERGDAVFDFMRIGFLQLQKFDSKKIRVEENIII